MPNVASALKDEMARVARKEVRGATQRLKLVTGRYRSQLAALKRQLTALERQVATLARKASKRDGVSAIPDQERKVRFSAKSLLAQRRRLGLSGTEVARLLGVSAQSIYKWEAGKVRPRADQIAAIAALRQLTKRVAKARLNQ